MRCVRLAKTTTTLVGVALLWLVLGCANCARALSGVFRLGIKQGREGVDVKGCGPCPNLCGALPCLLVVERVSWRLSAVASEGTSRWVLGVSDERRGRAERFCGGTFALLEAIERVWTADGDEEVSIKGTRESVMHV